MTVSTQTRHYVFTPDGRIREFSPEQAARVADALAYVGAPLSPADREALRAAAATPDPSGAIRRVHTMKNADRCSCDKPVLQEHSDQKGSSQSWCGRCKKPLSLRVALFRSAFA